jgi:hypothetical protein
VHRLAGGGRPDRKGSFGEPSKRSSSTPFPEERRMTRRPREVRAAAPVPGGTVDAEVQDCTQLYPQRASVSKVTDDGRKVALDILVLIDMKESLGVATALRDASTEEEKAAAQAKMDELVTKVRAQLQAGKISYEAIDIEYRFAAWDLLAPFKADGTPRDRSATEARNSQSLINLAKSSLGGKRPEGIDIVYVITDQNIFAPGIGDAVAGQADCIGGVAWDDRAFGVGEFFASIRLGPVTFYREGTAKIMGHEIGHLMGAHHHYQTCGAEAVSEASAGGFGACSLMTNAVDFQGFPFSPVSAAVVRAHALEFADRP